VRSKPWTTWIGSASIVALFSLAGCGPGVGGTGTGAALTAFGASAAPVCSSAIAVELDCAQAPAASGMGVNSGTLPIQFVDVAGQVTLDVNGNIGTLKSSCLRLQFGGEFGNDATGDGFFGSYQIDASGTDVLATVSTSPATGGLTVELRDLSGQVVVAPLLLHRAPVPLPAQGPC
jgi:hypothetical protein